MERCAGSHDAADRLGQRIDATGLAWITHTHVVHHVVARTLGQSRISESPEDTTEPRFGKVSPRGSWDSTPYRHNDEEGVLVQERRQPQD